MAPTSEEREESFLTEGASWHTSGLRGKKKKGEVRPGKEPTISGVRSERRLERRGDSRRRKESCAINRICNNNNLCT